jgi:3-phosphoshikimate 1-carboxyvinyltransferase
VITLDVPSSKSLTQRALVLAALAPGRSLIERPLECDDSQVLRRALRALGARIEERPDGWEVEGVATLQGPRAPLHLGNAGTAVRFCTGLSLLATGPVTIDGDPAMRRRPMQGLLDALAQLGARVEEHGLAHCPPVTIHPPPSGGDRPAVVRLDPAGTSQPLSALLLTAPRLDGGLEIHVEGTLPSAPYVALTLEALAAFGAEVRQSGPRFRVRPGGLRPTRYEVEGDHSSASYPLAAGWLTGREVTVRNVRPDSRQGDRIFADLLGRLETPAPRTFSLRDTPDIAPTLATCALFASGETSLTGLSHLRIKESDRLAVLARGFRQVGADLDETGDGLTIRQAPLHGEVTLDPAADHRMAMCFGLLGLRLQSIRITDHDCVNKSYPGYFEMLKRFAHETP